MGTDIPRSEGEAGVGSISKGQEDYANISNVNTVFAANMRYSGTGIGDWAFASEVNKKDQSEFEFARIYRLFVGVEYEPSVAAISVKIDVHSRSSASVAFFRFRGTTETSRFELSHPRAQQ